MSKTARHGLPLIASEQAQKHVTHNEAMALVDMLIHARLVETGRDMPPASPEPGDSYGIGDAPGGAWEGHAGEIAGWTEGGWRFSVPTEGLIVWDGSGQRMLVFRQGAWTGLFDAIGGLGIGAAADAINRLLVRSEAALFTADSAQSGNVRLTVNKESTADSATLMFQSGYSARAEMGLAGNDDFAFKVSADGSGFRTAMTVAAASGAVTFAALAGNAVSFPAVADGVLTVATGHVVPVPQSGSADDIETIAGGADGTLLVVSGTNGVTLTFRHGSGNLRLGTDRVLAAAGDTLMLVRRGAEWLALSHSQNG
ncbi:DUF2793 domain-containing protein [Pelagibacterium lacus]|uniref:DUF2793 domain-containing protein n=1 Tax=Pelagibacterium lacus TaxID=2282655 RepID=A0A369WAY2_9HYPH|nr:DUF2793 domain-containing protein [Pelagibacterium lacus]RDE10462.1 DUF2793 domain-containing protein [Pelagibacterium lacus]